MDILRLHNTNGLLFQWIQKLGGPCYGQLLATAVTALGGFVWQIGRTFNVMYLADLASDLPSLGSVGLDFPFGKLLTARWFQFEVLLCLWETLLAIPRTRTLSVIFFGFVLIMTHILTARPKVTGDMPIV